MDVLNQLREAKHKAFVIRKKIVRFMRDARNRSVGKRATLRGFELDIEEYLYRFDGGEGALILPRSSTFPVNHLLFNCSEVVDIDLELIPEKVYTIWFGGQNLPSNRAASLMKIREENAELEVVLVTDENFEEFVADQSPLHPSFENLAAIHKSDYMRAYLMHHYGGAYTDLKPLRGKLNSTIQRINGDRNLWGGGMGEGPGNVGAALGGKLGRDQNRNFSITPSQACFAYRPRTPFTFAWMEELNRRMDYYSSVLVEGSARHPFGNQVGYPVSHFALLAHIYNPLALKYNKHLWIDDGLSYPDLPMSAYR